MGERSLEHLSHLPNHRVMEIEGAGHPAYIEKPDQWERALYNFLSALETGQADQ